MTHVFWFIGRSGSGKSTLTKKIKKIIEKEYEIQILDGDDLAQSFGQSDLRKKNMDLFLKNVINDIFDELHKKRTKNLFSF